MFIPNLSWMNIHNIPQSYNVQFYPRNTIETYQMMATDTFAQRLAVDVWTRRMLFPSDHHGIHLPKRDLGKAKFDLTWVDPELNYEQQVPHPVHVANKESSRCHRVRVVRRPSLPHLRPPWHRKNKNRNRSNNATHPR